MNVASGRTGKPTVGIRDDAVEPTGMYSRRVGVQLPRRRMAPAGSESEPSITQALSPAYASRNDSECRGGTRSKNTGNTSSAMAQNTCPWNC